MIRYCLYLILYLISVCLAGVLNPIVVLFRIDTPVGPKLPKWLSYFDTDTSLWGDLGWQTIHYPNYKSYWGMVRWLYRNPVFGFSNTVLKAKLTAETTYDVKPSIEGLSLNKGSHPDTFGSFLITSSNGYFHYRTVKKLGNYKWGLDIGWELDSTVLKYPNACTLFMFHPTLPKRLVENA